MKRNTIRPPVIGGGETFEGLGNGTIKMTEVLLLIFQLNRQGQASAAMGKMDIWPLCNVMDVSSRGVILCRCAAKRDHKNCRNGP